MKIVQVIDSLKGGGAERVCLEIHRQFLSLGHQSQIFITHNKADYDTDDNVIYVPAEHVIDEVEKNQYDLVIGRMTHAAKVLRKIKKRKNVFFVVHTTLSEKMKKKGLLDRIRSTIISMLVYREANVVCVSRWIENDLLHKMKIKPNTIQTIYNPFDFKKIIRMAQEECAMDFDYIVSAGRLSQVKRYDLLIESFAALDTKLHLVLLGKGEKLSELKVLARELNVENRVHFPGWVTNPHKYIKNARLFVLSSDIEGLPGVVIESLIIGTPVVSTNCPSGIGEIMTGEFSKYLASVGDAQSLKKKIEMALESYPNIDADMLTKFSSNKITNEYLKLGLDN